MLTNVGYIESGVIPKFASCENEGVPYFKEKGLWQEKDYMAKAGDIIFFDWDENQTADHVGIVQKVNDGIIYTIEGNSEDMCRQNTYTTDSSSILGYGTPVYIFAN